MIRFKHIITLFFLLIFSVTFFAQTSEKFDLSQLKNLKAEKDYMSRKLIVKLHDNKRHVFEAKGTGNFKYVYQDMDLEVEKMFPHKKALVETRNKLNQPLVDLSLIYTIDFGENLKLEEVIPQLNKSGLFEYVEPYIIPQLLYNPNDPFLSNQYYIDKIEAFEAWDITKGDTNVVIGIVDSGTDITHPDLINSIKYNYYDTIDGFDNDNDGFTDNYQGWDLGENDNDPQWTTNAHGVHVAGIAAAKADNGTGIAGVSFSCKYLPVKVTDQYGVLTKAYQGVVYAADNNCKVINCSWGNTIPTHFGEDIVNYATYNRNALVIAASGNENNEKLYFPASYTNVLSVAATDANDKKWIDPNNNTGSNYNYYVGISAPGHQIMSTWASGTYLSSTGTSMATPVVSGCAAIVASHFPSYLPAQIKHKLKVTADNIDGVPGNSAYANKMGSGRVNLYNALSQNFSPSVNMVSFNHTNEEFAQFGPGDTILLSGNFVNFLAPTVNLKCTLTSLSNYVTVLDSVIIFPSTINTLDTANNDSFPFKIKVNASMPASTKMDFRLKFTDLNYTEKQYFSKVFYVDYFNIDTNKVATTFTSKSRIGYNDIMRTQGLGLFYENSILSQLSFGGFIVGISPTQVSDNIYGGVSGTYNNMFFSLSKAQKIIPPVTSDFDAVAVFNDSLAGVNKIGVEIINNAYAWNNPADEKYIIYEYKIINKNATQLNNLYAGLFIDWDIEERMYHMSDFEESINLGYSYSTQGSFYQGIKLLTGGNYRFYAFDNMNGIKIKDGFTNYEKYLSLRTNKFQGGTSSADNDIANLFGCGPFAPNPNDTVTIAFAIILGDHFNDIVQSANNAQNRYGAINNSILNSDNKQPHIFIYPNPATEQVQILLNGIQGNACVMDIIEITGRLLSSEEIKINGQNQLVSLDTKNFKRGVYIIRLQTGNSVLTHPLVVY